MSKTKRQDKKLSTRKQDTHLRLIPFIDENNSRFLVYCLCASHPGFLKLPSDPFKFHCSENICSSHLKIKIQNNHEYDPEFLKRYQEDILRKADSDYFSLVLRAIPRRDEANKLFFWAKDSGDFIYVLKQGMEERLSGQDNFFGIERDHFKLYLHR